MGWPAADGRSDEISIPGSLRTGVYRGGWDGTYFAFDLGLSLRLSPRLLGPPTSAVSEVIETTLIPVGTRSTQISVCLNILLPPARPDHSIPIERCQIHKLPLASPLLGGPS